MCGGQGRVTRARIMQYVLGAILIVLALVLAAILAGRLGLLQGRPPAGLGLNDGRLRPPSKTPNSVSSGAALYPDHPMRAYASIEPLAYSGDGAQALARLAAIVESMEGAQIARSEPGYLYATWTTRLMRFVDDVEFALDQAASVIHVRSASRIGYSDRGLNRARVEAIRSRFAG